MKYIEMRGKNPLKAVVKGSEANAHLVANLALLDGVPASMDQYNFTREQVLDTLRFYLENETAIEQERKARGEMYNSGTAQEQMTRFLEQKARRKSGKIGTTNAERILESVAHIVKNEGRKIFTRAEVYKNIASSVFFRPSYDPVFQGMRIDQPGGAPSPREEYQNVFEQVSHGKYRLTSYGHELINKLY